MKGSYSRLLPILAGLCTHLLASLYAPNNPDTANRRDHYGWVRSRFAPDLLSSALSSPHVEFKT